MDQGEVRRALGEAGVDRGREGCREGVVDLDGGDVSCRLQEAQGQGAEARAYLHHYVVVVDVRGADDAADGVRVDDEVLAALFGGTDAQLGGQLADVGGPQQGIGGRCGG